MTGNGDRVPITIEMSHPMEPGHHITRVTVVNERDPVPLKGVFELTPTTGLVLPRLPGADRRGSSEVAVTAECNLHGAWTSTGTVRVADGAGGLLRPVAVQGAGRLDGDPSAAPAPAGARADRPRPRRTRCWRRSS